MAGHFTKLLAKWDRESNRLRKIAYAEQTARLKAIQVKPRQLDFMDLSDILRDAAKDAEAEASAQENQ